MTVQRTIEIIFGAVDDTASGIASVSERIKGLGDNIGSATQPIADFTTAALSIEAGLLAAGTAMALFSVHKAGEFESALLDLKKVLSDTDAPLEQFAAAADEISRRYGIAATDVLASTTNFKQAGFDGAEALTLVRNALDLKTAGDIESARASDILVASLKGFQLEAESAAQIVDLLNAVSDNYATNVNELATGFSALSPVARAAGFSLEETAGVLTPVIEVFRSGSEAANAMRTVFLRLQSDTGPVVEALKTLKVSQHDANGELRSARDIYFDVAEAFGGLDDSQKTYLASQLAGLDQSAKFIAAMEGLATTNEIAGDSFEYLGSAAREVEIKLGAADVAVARAAIAFDSLARAIGTPLLDEYRGISDAISNIFAALAESTQVDGSGLNELITYVESVALDIQRAFEEVARNLPEALASADMSGFVDGIDAVIEALTSLFGGIDLTTVDGLRNGIELVGTAFLGLSHYTAGVIESFEPLFRWLVDAASGVGDLDTELARMLGNIGGAITQLNALAGVISSMASWLGSVSAALLSPTGIAGGLAALAGGAAAAVSSMGPLHAAAASLVGLLSSVAGGATVASVGLASSAGLAGAAGAAGYAVGTLLNEGLNRTISAIAGTETSLGGLIYDLLHTEEQAKETAAVVDGMGLTLDELNRGVESGALVWDFALGAWTRARQASTDLADGLDGIAGAVTRVTDGPFTNYLNAQGEVISRTVESQQALDEWNEKILASGGVTEEAARSMSALGRGLIETGLLINEATGAVVGYSGAYEDLSEAEKEALARGSTREQQLQNTADKTRATADEMRRAAEAAERWNLAMAQMQHEERLALIESQTAITTARIEADARRAVAAYESITAAIQSTGETMASLYNTLGEGDLSLRQQMDLERELSRESQRRDEALELQRRLIEAQIEETEARASALERGDSLITIQGDGLAPHLEAFMWEILRAIQVRVNADGLDMLMGTQS